MSRVLVCVTICVVVGLAACGGASSTDNVDKRAAAAISAGSDDLDRLARAVAEADVTDRSSLIEVRAAAGRASRSLSDTRGELRALMQGTGLSDSQMRSLRTQISALSDIQDLADALSAEKLSTPRILAAASRERLAVSDLQTVVDVPVIQADQLADDLRDARAKDVQAKLAKRRRAAARRAKRRADLARTGQPSAPVGSGSAGSGISYFSYTGPAFVARLPQGPGWGSPSESQPTPGRLYRTNVRGPGGLFVIIDYTPYEPARFGGGATGVPVRNPTFGTALRYQFTGGNIPECRSAQCTDYIINDSASGSGFGVLAGGGSASAAIAQTVAESVLPLGE